MDWSEGRFEVIARQLLPASKLAVEICDPRPGERILDLGCGTGNASELLAALGSEVTAVDPAPRLLSVARERLSALDLAATFLDATAEALPFDDASFDAIVSVFAVVFASSPQVAAAEIARVMRPSGRLVMTAWRPEGALFQLGALRRQAMIDAGAVPAIQPPSFAWFDEEALRSLFDPHGLHVDVRQAQLEFVAASPDAFAFEEFEFNPLLVDARRALEPLGQWEPLKAALTKSIVSSNEDPDGFRLTSQFVVNVVSKVGPAAMSA